MVAAANTEPTLKQSCAVDLTFPYHREENALEHLHALSDFIGEDRDKLAQSKDVLEQELAALFGKAAALWFPTGTMAQGIAARIHAERAKSRTLILHPTSHLLLHEEEGYKHLHGLEAQVVGDWRDTIKPDMLTAGAACAFVEMSQRHSGGLLPSWQELCALKQRARDLALPLHMDGARIWSCRPHYDNRSFAEVADGFSSLYVSLYKDIGALPGAVLIGDQDFIDEAKVWQARMGGALVHATLMAADALRLVDQRLTQMEGFIVHARLMADAVTDIAGVTVSPARPQTNLFHLMLPCGPKTAEQARDRVAQETGIWLSNRFWAYEGEQICAMEITVGEKALALPLDTFADAVRNLLKFIGE